jgi:hypothetical protein
MNIFVVFKAYRQVNGEYQAVEVEAAYPTREAAEAAIKGRQSSWFETKQVPIMTGGTMPVEFQGVLAVHETELKGA